jgi:AP-4 complex subunit mu-1
VASPPPAPLPPHARAPQIRADIPESNYGTNVVIKFPVPKNVATVTPELGPGALAAPAAKGVAAAVVAAAAPPPANQSVEFIAKDKEVVWSIKKFQGQAEHTLRTRITLSSPSSSNLRKELGPVSMAFEVPMFNTSNLQVRYLRIAETHKNYKPHRWVRYVTQSSSYVCRL